MKNEVVLYQNKSGAIEFKSDVKRETLWASLQQIADLFGRDKSVISRHIKHIFADGELSRKSVVAFFATTAGDGKTYQVEYFNLDMILSVGYRVNSKTATKFRQWATATLRKHILDGYTINKSRIAKNYEHFLQAVSDVKKLLPKETNVRAEDALDLVKMFAGTWFSLDAYDTEALPKTGKNKKSVKLTADDLYEAVFDLKKDLMKKRQATELFAQEKNEGALGGIVGNVLQAFGGSDVYSTVEEKSAHLLYFIVKNHPFNDGNKRSGAFAFVWFLKKARALDTQKITPESLTALTLLIAESNPKDKDRMIGLVLLLLGAGKRN